MSGDSSMKKFENQRTADVKNHPTQVSTSNHKLPLLDLALYISMHAHFREGVLLQMTLLFFLCILRDLPQEKNPRASYQGIKLPISICSHIILIKENPLCAWRFPCSWVLLRFGNTFKLTSWGGPPSLGNHWENPLTW